MQSPAIIFEPSEEMDPIDIQDYQYELPEQKIAAFPLPERDQSKLLVYSQGQITHSIFYDITSFLPSNTFLFFNNTKVIPARLLFQKDTGAVVEIFLLKPGAGMSLQTAMESVGSVEWQCTIGNLKRWPAGTKLVRHLDSLEIAAELTDRESGLVKLSWRPAELNFADVIQKVGVTPLPPYIKRSAQQEDKTRYQTVYSQTEGAVAAPTAGLHFTDTVLSKLTQMGISTDFLTLHVSAGTFQPVKVQNVLDHPMHAEEVVVTRKNIENLLLAGKTFVAVGTTSLRTLESIYWYGVMLLKDPEAVFRITPFQPYQLERHPSVQHAVQAVADAMDRRGEDTIVGITSIFILPGYSFKICKALITNFHQPGSTLMLLVAAFVGPAWKTVYGEALTNDYRFLSFGDSSLLIP